MGEYATIQGVEVKLGTCDDWRYVRHDEAERWQHTANGGGDGIRWALAEPSILWRFPYAWEDNGHPADLNERTMGRPSIICAVPGPPSAHDHRRFCVGCSPSGGGFNVNIYVPCPYTLSGRFGQEPASDLEIQYCSAVPDRMLAEIWGERHSGERGHRTVFRCIYCKAPFCLTPNEVSEVEPVAGGSDDRGEAMRQSIRERLKGAVL